MKLAYPIILTPYEDHNGGYVVEVPDLPGCVTGGDNIAEALLMAQDAASGWVLTELEAGRPAPTPSDPRSIKMEDPTSTVSMVALDMDAYAAQYGGKAVRKNVTIPAWLDTWAQKAGINYSGMLRNALEAQYQHAAQTMPA